MKKFRKYIVLLATLIIVLSLDLFTKAFFEGKRFSLIKNFIGIYSCHNTGAAFSIFSGKQTFLIIFTTLLLIMLCSYFYFSKIKNYVWEISLSMIISGAIGNLYDRIFLGYVRDFIDLEFMNFAIFNIADSFLTIGIVGICIYILFFDETFKTQKKVTA